MGSEDSSIFYFVRHGECMGNITRRNLAPDEAVLTSNGKLQAELLGKELEDVKFTLAYTSDFPRALETAQIVLSKSKGSSNIELHKDVRLRERNMGKFENGVEISVFLADFIASKKDFLDYEPEGGETRVEIETRIEEFLQESLSNVESQSESQKVLVVTHGAVLLHLWQYLLAPTTNYNLNNWRPEYYKITRNTGYYILEVPKHGASKTGTETPRELNLISALCSDHLKPLDTDTLDKFTRENKTANAFAGCIQQ